MITVASKDCDHNFCRNGASCMDLQEGGYVCKCKPDFEGIHCEG